MRPAPTRDQACRSPQRSERPQTPCRSTAAWRGTGESARTFCVLTFSGALQEYDRAAWEELIERCEATGIDAFEINFSCPHGMPERKMGMAMGQDCDLLEVRPPCTRMQRMTVIQLMCEWRLLRLALRCQPDSETGTTVPALGLPRCPDASASRDLMACLVEQAALHSIVHVSRSGAVAYTYRRCAAGSTPRRRCRCGRR